VRFVCGQFKECQKFAFNLLLELVVATWNRILNKVIFRISQFLFKGLKKDFENINVWSQLHHYQEAYRC
jgi:hypothetical protein